MSYWDVAEMASDYDITQRSAACAAQEEIPGAYQWASQNQLDICAAEGWDEAWASARAGQGELAEGETFQPGRDEGVITDGMILASVQAVAARGRAA